MSDYDKRLREIEKVMDALNILQVMRNCAFDGSGPELTAEEEADFDEAVDHLGTRDVPWLLEELAKARAEIQHKNIWNYARGVLHRVFR